MDDIYYKKYLKYKTKYLDFKHKILTGGLINEYSLNRINEHKTKKEIPISIQNILNYITPPNSKVIRVGSSNLRVFEVSADLDNMIFYELLNEESYNVVSKFVKELQTLVKKILEDPNIYFSDFKANKYHWSTDEILAGINKEGVTLEYAVAQHEVLKIDIIAPLNGRYIEASAFYILKSKNGYVNVSNDYFNSFEESLLLDIEELKNIKPFKAVKRTFSLGRLKKNNEILKKLLPIVRSSIASLAVINADIETLVLMLEHNDKLNINYIIEEINNFKERLSSLIDLKFDTERTLYLIDNMILQFKVYNNTKEAKEKLIKLLDELHEYLLKVINDETNEFLRSIGFTFPSISTNSKNIESVTKDMDI